MARRSAKSTSGRGSQRSRTSPTHEVHCPQCGGNYMIPEEKLDRKVQCRKCTKVFIPMNILRKSSRRTKSTGMPSGATVSIIIGVLAIIISAIVLNNKLNPDVPVVIPKKAEYKGPSQEELLLMARPVEHLERFITAAKTGDEMELDRRTDFNAFFQQFTAEERPKDRKGKLVEWDYLDPPDQVKWHDRIVKEITEGRFGAPLRGKALVAGDTRIDGPLRSPLTEKNLKLKATFQPGDDPRITFTLGFDMVKAGSKKNPRWQVQNVTTIKSPKAKKKKKKRKMPKGLDGSKIVEKVSVDGKRVIQEHPIVPMGHLDDTLQELRDEIDKLIDVVGDTEARPGPVHKAIQRLIEIGRPSFPRLLNLFYDIHHSEDPESYENRTVLVRLIKNCLVPMIDCDYGYTPALDVAGDVEAATKTRASALKQYYAWWGRNYSKAKWKALKAKMNEEEEEIL